MVKILVLGWIGTWLGVFFGVMDAAGWLAFATANVAATVWTGVWLMIAALFDL